ncbi:cytochrome P450 [Streptomyces albospinus]|nr:cytochrome P450 [Streptomyces albospinus]
MELDLIHLDFWHKPLEDRNRVFRQLRADPRPVFCPTDDGHGFFALTRYGDVLTASRNTQVFSSEPISTSPDNPSPEVLEFAGSIISLDAPQHTRLRRIVSRAFTPKMIGNLAEDIAGIARGIVDDLVDKGPCDFVAEVSMLMPMRVICRMLGIPASMEAEVIGLTDMILAAGDPDYATAGGNDRDATLVAKYTKLHAFAAELASARRRQPGDDLVTKLITADIDGECLTQKELGKFFTLLLVAGSETARNTLSHTLALLTDHPGQRDLLLDDLPGRLPRTIEEVLRYATPTTWMRRDVKSDIELSGNTYRAGDRVVMFYNSANRDETAFKDPDTFDITRHPNPHVSFGAPGPHFCLGAHLARHQISVLLRELFTRLPDIHTTSPGTRHLSSFVNGHQSLPCAF